MRAVASILLVVGVLIAGCQTAAQSNPTNTPISATPTADQQTREAADQVERIMALRAATLDLLAWGSSVKADMAPLKSIDDICADPWTHGGRQPLFDNFWPAAYKELDYTVAGICHTWDQRATLHSSEKSAAVVFYSMLEEAFAPVRGDEHFDVRNAVATRVAEAQTH